MPTMNSNLKLIKLAGILHFRGFYKESEKILKLARVDFKVGEKIMCETMHSGWVPGVVTKVLKDSSVFDVLGQDTFEIKLFEDNKLNPRQRGKGLGGKTLRVNQSDLSKYREGEVPKAETPWHEHSDTKKMRQYWSKGIGAGFSNAWKELYNMEYTFAAYAIGTFASFIPGAIGIKADATMIAADWAAWERRPSKIRSRDEYLKLPKESRATYKNNIRVSVSHWCSIIASALSLFASLIGAIVGAGTGGASYLLTTLPLAKLKIGIRTFQALVGIGGFAILEQGIGIIKKAFKWIMDQINGASKHALAVVDKMKKKASYIAKEFTFVELVKDSSEVGAKIIQILSNISWGDFQKYFDNFAMINVIDKQSPA
jgi:hypothetical protein